MKFVRPLLFSGLLALSGITSADTLSISLGAGIWYDSPSGGVNDGATTKFDAKQDLFWSEESQGYFFLTFEHPVPFVPNVRLSATKLEHGGAGTLTRTITIGGVDYPVSEYITNSFKLDQKDLLLYWEILDNVVSFDLGLNVKLADLSYTVTGDTVGTNSDSYKATIPMIYGLLGVSPIPDLIISVEGSYITYSGTTVSDMMARIAYTTPYFVGVEAGYRSQTYQFTNIAGFDGNLDFKGPFAGVYVKF